MNIPDELIDELKFRIVNDTLHSSDPADHLKLKAGKGGTWNASEFASSLTIDKLLSAGDIVKFRIASMVVQTHDIELTMLQPPEKPREKVNRRIIWEPTKFMSLEAFTGRKFDYALMRTQDALRTLKWWRGALFEHPHLESLPPPERKEEDVDYVEVMSESPEMSVGRWRRVYETSMLSNKESADRLKFTKHARKVDQEIGSLRGIDEVFKGDYLKVGNFMDINCIGTYLDRSQVPTEWLPNVTYFDELDNFIQRYNATVSAVADVS